jgi:hypothetical protein
MQAKAERAEIQAKMEAERAEMQAKIEAERAEMMQAKMQVKLLEQQQVTTKDQLATLRCRKG